MKSFEFITELHSGEPLAIPDEIASQLPANAKAKVILLFEDDSEDDLWRRSAYEEFMKEDSSEDSVYDKYA